MGQTESGWQLEASAPELYERYMVPAVARLWAADLVERAAPKPGERVLDIACGTGIVARFAAATIGTGHVVGLDINEGMLAVARSRSASLGLHIEWREASALDLPFADSSFDLILCVNAGEKMHQRAGVKLHHGWMPNAPTGGLLLRDKQDEKCVASPANVPETSSVA